jgi:hypothetical protein
MSDTQLSHNIPLTIWELRGVTVTVHLTASGSRAHHPASKSRLRLPTLALRATADWPADCLTGKSLNSCPAPLAKIFLFAPYPNHPYINHRLVPLEGRFAVVTNAGRDAVDADVPLTNGTEADGEVVWS